MKNATAVFDRLNQLLQTLKTDLGLLLMIIAGIVGTVAIILLMVDHRTAPTTRSSRWTFFAYALLGAFLFGSLGGMLAFSQQIGSFLFGVFTK